MKVNLCRCSELYTLLYTVHCALGQGEATGQTVPPDLLGAELIKDHLRLIKSKFII